MRRGRNRPGEGRPVLVTGTSSGIGLATAVHLAELGFRTIGTVRDPADVELVTEEAARHDVRIEPRVLDVADDDACEQLVTGLELYGLVNNAGFFNVGTVEDVPIGDARRQFDAMVLGPMQLARHALSGMRERGGGRIVNVSSSMVHLSLALTGWYQASNHALSAVSDALRMEVASSGIDVITIEPGGIETDIWRKAEQDLNRRGPDSRAETAYERALRILHAFQGRIHPPAMVAEIIGTALTVRRPKVRYSAGREVELLRAAGVLLPRRIRDVAVRAALQL